MTLMPHLGMLMPNMGIKGPVRSATRLRASRSATLADALFTGTQQRVLGLLFGQPARSFYATEVISLAGSGVLALIAVPDLSRSGGLAALEFAIAGAVALVSLGSFTGMYRAAASDADR